MSGFILQNMPPDCVYTSVSQLEASEGFTIMVIRYKIVEHCVGSVPRKPLPSCQTEGIGLTVRKQEKEELQRINYQTSMDSLRSTVWLIEYYISVKQTCKQEYSDDVWFQNLLIKVLWERSNLKDKYRFPTRLPHLCYPIIVVSTWSRSLRYMWLSAFDYASFFLCTDVTVCSSQLSW